MSQPKKKRFVRPFQDGERYIRQLGYQKLKDFFAGPEWNAAKKKRLLKHPRCLFCNEPATEVFLFENTEDSLSAADHKTSTTLCGECQRAICRDGERKRTMTEANRVIRDMANTKKMHEFLSSTAFAGRHRPSDSPKVAPKQVKCKTCGKNPCKKGRVECGRCRRIVADAKKVVVANTKAGQCEGCSRVKSGLAGCSIEGVSTPSSPAVMLCESCRNCYGDRVVVRAEYLGEAPEKKPSKAAPKKA